jgi:GDPmannose 4,6-dehydratase
MKRALITGITGQDGSYLAEFLLAKGYEVHGVMRRSSTFNTSRLDHIYEDPHEPQPHLFLHYGDLGTGERLIDLIYTLQPEEVYHLGAQSHVKVSFSMPEYTGAVTGLGTTRLLDAIRTAGVKSKFYQASSSEMFGNSPAPQSESSPFHPRSPYGAAKLYAYWMAVNYREAHGVFASNGILFNHESPRRGETFVTRKITRAIAGILSGREKAVYLGNLAARRDWGYAPEYVEAMWRILQLDEPGDFVLGTGETHTVQEFAEEAFSYVKLDWREFVVLDPKYARPAEVDHLQADARRARELLDWNPKITFHELVCIMVDADMEAAGLVPVGEGARVMQEKFQNWHQWQQSVSQLLNAVEGHAHSQTAA